MLTSVKNRRNNGKKQKKKAYKSRPKITRWLVVDRSKK